MLEQLASAIVGALVAGAAKATHVVVGDAYTSAKTLLKELVPRFDSNIDEGRSHEEAVDELAQRLKGLTEEERVQLAEEMEKLADKSGAAESAAVLRQHVKYTVERMKAGGDVELEFGAEAEHVFRDIEAGRNITVRTSKSLK
jgi:hypothetical protein